ncbi:hypothetical protein P5X00_39830 (plasmid) [Paraburkholderia sp. A2RO-4L]|uniref:hypothetical protein n=1 Tax=Paraburkholderia sp. A2RO-4L TaxID=3028374 RepID=UPI003DA8068B
MLYLIDKVLLQFINIADKMLKIIYFELTRLQAACHKAFDALSEIRNRNAGCPNKRYLR